ncbi:hypothetical protein GCM10010177_79850 [Actinomadura citrea]|nr:hypothetical protein GCM10010177_79850 [Actinomadura citrea]
MRRSWADILDKANLRQVVADASGQAGELRAEVEDLVLRSADGGEPIRAFVDMQAALEKMLRLTPISAVISARRRRRSRAAGGRLRTILRAFHLVVMDRCMVV